MNATKKYNQFKLNPAMSQQQRDSVAIQLRKHGFHAHIEVDLSNGFDDEFLFTDASAALVAILNGGTLGVLHNER